MLRAAFTGTRPNICSDVSSFLLVESWDCMAGCRCV